MKWLEPIQLGQLRLEGGQVTSWDELFTSSLGRNCLRLMMREYVASIALEMHQRETTGSNVREIQTDDAYVNSVMSNLQFFMSKFTLTESVKHFRKFEEPPVTSVAKPRIFGFLKGMFQKDTKSTKTLSTSNNDRLFKCVVFGPEKVGKSSLLISLWREGFFETLPPSIGTDFKVMNLHFGTAFKIKVSFLYTTCQSQIEYCMG